jgi:hypothetical protein
MKKKTFESLKTLLGEQFRSEADMANGYDPLQYLWL